MSTFVIAEIGINHNGDLDIAKKLIDGAVFAGCDAVKFQKRTVDKIYSKGELDKPRESPWGSTVRDQKIGLEFGKKEYDEIDKYCKEKGIEPYKEYSGKFNLRIPPELHAEIASKASTEGKSLNQWIVDTLDQIVHAH